MREIAERAQANLASANYHFGSKQHLYLEVSRRQFEAIEQRLAEEGVRLPAAGGRGPSRAVLEGRLTARIHVLLELLLEPPNQHGLLMQRELCDPSEALPVIVKRFIEPLRRDMDRLVSRLAPDLSLEQVDRCTRSVVAQIYFYISHRPALLQMMGRDSYPRGFARRIARHVSRFSLGGIAAVAAAAAERPTRRANPRRRGIA